VGYNKRKSEKETGRSGQYIMKRFNVTGICVPEENYMVDISGKIAQIKKLIDNRNYFTINRARQYGKTTTLYELRKRLPDEYLVVKISFEGLGDESFASPERFCPALVKQIVRALQFTSAEKEYIKQWENCHIADFDSLDDHITKMCREKKIVLMIDEVDKTSNNRVFLNFLSILRKKYLARAGGDDFTFHSVILAGVYDVKNIKLKLINAGLYTPTEGENKIYNSPWNIAVDFEVDMSFCPAEIATMLGEYEADHSTGMDIAAISNEIYAYTSGYPFLVSRICQHIDEKLEQNWNKDGIEEAVRMLLSEQNTLFDDLFKNIHNNEKLRELLYDLLFVGREIPFGIDHETIGMGFMYGFLKDANGKTRVSNKIFEMRIYNYFVLQEIIDADYSLNSAKSAIVHGGRFDMSVCLEKFRQHYAEITSGKDIKFLERHGTLLFLSYLKPLINGEGDYYIEPQIGDFRMDIAVQYKSEQFIIELKLWRGEEYQKEAHKQLLGYMASKKADKGYLLTFDFRKEKNKESKAEWVEFDGKKIFEVIV